MSQCNIFQIQRLSVNDGDGIRTTVFFKGCPLRCKWCANPESWKQREELMVLKNKCVNCGRCLTCSQLANRKAVDGSLVFLPEKCVLCGKCILTCPAKARQRMGQIVDVKAVLQEIVKDYVFYQESNGGVTFSGGEPFAQSQALRELVQGCVEMGIQTAVESSAYFDFEACKDIIEAIDHIFFDIKIMDSAEHFHFCGVGNERILENIRKASLLQPNIVVRMPIIVGVNASEENVEKLCRFLKEDTNIKRIELLPYHRLGLEKMESIGKESPVFAIPSDVGMDSFRQVIKAAGLENVSYR